MAPVVTAVQPPMPTGKVKRPIPPGIQTNGNGPSRPSPSPSPSMSAKKPPNGAKQNANSATNAAAGGAQQTARPQSRSRRETSAQLMGRNSRNSAGLRSASLAADAFPQSLEPPPYIVTDEYILKRYAGNPPSLIVHMHATHFKFDQQDGVFPYKSPMKLFLEHLRARTVPHEILLQLTQAGVTFYEGCLIVQVHDHKSATQTNDAPKPSATANATPVSSIHNYNPYLTPSTTTPHPKLEPKTEGEDDAMTTDEDSKEKTAEEKDKESMPAPDLPTEAKSKPPPKPKIFTVVLHPTAQSLQTDLLIKASTPRSSLDVKDGAPPSTPLTAVPPPIPAASMPPPAKKQKRERMELDGSNIYAVEGEYLVNTMAPLMLEPARNAEEVMALLDAKAHPMHSDPPPQPKTRKRTVAEMAADQALIADQERYMLLLDERLASTASGNQGATGGTDGDIRAGGAAFEPRFERFQVIADIKREHAEKKEQERIKQAENQRRVELQRQQQQLQEQQRQMEAEKQRKEAQMRENMARQQQQQEAQRKAMVAQAQATKQAAAAAAKQQQQQQQQAKTLAAQQAQQNANAAAAAQATAAKAAAAKSTQANKPPPVNAAAANAAANNAHANAMQQAQATPRFHQQVGQQQPQVSSPVVRQGTPHSMSSPMPGAVQMQQQGSNMAGSPPRPPSVVQNHTPMAVPMSRGMSARNSQQSHAAGTPRMPSSTPNMPNATPINRHSVIQTPRMSQASPPPAMMAQASQQQMGTPTMMTAQGVSQQMHQQNVMAAQLAAQQRRMLVQQQQQQQQQQMMQNGGMAGVNLNVNGQTLTPQQQQMIQQQRLQQLLLQQQQRNGMVNPQQQLAQQYAQSMNQMQGQLTPQMQAQLQAQMARMNQMNQMQGQLTPQMQAQLQAQMAQMNQMNQMGQMPQMNQMGQVNQAANQMGAQMGRPMMPNQNMMNGGAVNMQAAMLQMQQQQAQAAQQNQTNQLNEQIRARGQLLYRNNITNLAAKFGGSVESIPGETLENFKKTCMQQARSQVAQQVQQQRVQQAMMHQAQAQAQQQMAMQQGMMGGHQGM